jgi:hypothetical protein
MVPCGGLIAMGDLTLEGKHQITYLPQGIK